MYRRFTHRHFTNEQPLYALATTIITVPNPRKDYSGVPSIRATIKQADGSEFPLAVLSAMVNIDWEHGDPVIVDIKAIGGFAVEAAAGLRHIEINGKQYRLVEVDHVTPAPHDVVDRGPVC